MRLPERFRSWRINRDIRDLPFLSLFWCWPALILLVTSISYLAFLHPPVLRQEWVVLDSRRLLVLGVQPGIDTEVITEEGGTRLSSGLKICLGLRLYEVRVAQPGVGAGVVELRDHPVGDFLQATGDLG